MKEVKNIGSKLTIETYHENKESHIGFFHKIFCGIHSVSFKSGFSRPWDNDERTYIEKTYSCGYTIKEVTIKKLNWN